MVWSGGNRRRLVAVAGASVRVTDAATSAGAGSVFGCDVGQYSVRCDSD